MRTKIDDQIKFLMNLEPESPITVDPSLPQIISFIIFLGMKTWVPEVSGQRIHLFDEHLLNLLRSFRQRHQGALRELDVHGFFFRVLALKPGVFMAFKKRAISSPFLNGP